MAIIKHSINQKHDHPQCRCSKYTRLFYWLRKFSKNFWIFFEKLSEKESLGLISTFLHPTLLHFTIYIIFLWQITIFTEISWWNLFFSIKQHFLSFLAILGHFWPFLPLRRRVGPNFDFFCIQLCFISVFISFFCGKSQFLLKLVDETCFFQENSIFCHFLTIFWPFLTLRRRVGT